MNKRGKGESIENNFENYEIKQPKEKEGKTYNNKCNKR